MSQYNDSSYYSGGGGGGYIAGGSPFSQGGSPGGRVRSDISHSLRPVKICQLNKATQAHVDAEFRLDDVELGNVSVVAQAVSIQPQATNCVYHLDDGTGRFEARHWVDQESETNVLNWGGLRESMYVRVTGSLKGFHGKRYLNTVHVRPITDKHEIFFHEMEAITANLTVERGPPGGTGPKATVTASGSKDVTMTDASAYSAPSTSVAQDQYAHLPKLQQAIVRFMMEQPPSPEGTHVFAIARAVGDGNDAQKISAALDQLMDEGLVYTTSDDNHFTLAN
ncbi:hypothetical protein DFP72DRAFT_896888 [Ephemerocybe angulata]|uniref:Replication protein A C-terminal domain-containing protein n=1 Tax=Ephemerocybe angulata TaxID=980116 RepID=A0A8H6M754_9AGAR|nr:hypothetical protein DFP72DRAFT_896888 [Tulosesus angulatus]